MGTNVKASEIIDSLSEDDGKAIYRAVGNAIIITACFFLTIGILCGVTFSIIAMR